MNEPLYANLARNLQAAICAGRHLPGSLLPGEHELADTHGVSRATVRAALHVLEKGGLVERKRGAGTRVLSPQPSAGFGQSVLSIGELIHYARDTRRVVKSVEEIVVDISLAGLLGIAPGSHWLQLNSLRIDPARPTRPICWSEAYIAVSLAAVTARLSDETTALCDLLLAQCGVRVDSIEQEIHSAIIPAGLSDRLVAEVGAPALQILRRYRDASGWLFLVTVGLHPSGRFAYRMKLERSAPSG
jgi:GntR family transcriptional regulator